VRIMSPVKRLSWMAAGTSGNEDSIDRTFTHCQS
jgi:hypothetical protein